MFLNDGDLLKMPFRWRISAHSVLSLQTSLPERMVQVIFWQFRNMQEQAVHFLATLKNGLDGHLILQGSKNCRAKELPRC